MVQLDDLESMEKDIDEIMRTDPKDLSRMLKLSRVSRTEFCRYVLDEDSSDLERFISELKTKPEIKLFFKSKNNSWKKGNYTERYQILGKVYDYLNSR